ncbi:hypothetical protein [Bradyrhizobium sp.]|uniref:hypothetical protein n=1 Tax=Bradyrhizobium sp. TaxID=376 RepID=UPI001EB3A806|nr:hypothetical protein [Bradyrhizobium sp.]MBV9978453.1 hypothetical protein [Bradyrhizobium sp.]
MAKKIKTTNGRKEIDEKRKRNAARKRRENAAERQREQDAREYDEIPPPLATVEIMPTVLQTGDSDIAMAFVKEMQPKKDFAGRYTQVGTVQHLNIALGVQTLLSYHGLVALLGSGAQAKGELGKLGGGSDTIDYRLNVGRTHLASRTAFESEEELKLWALCKYRLRMGHKAAPLGPEIGEKIVAESEAVRLVARAYDRAQRVSAAHKEAADMTADDAAVRLELAYTHSSTHVSSVEACQIALFADINPAELWMQYGAFFGKTFEFARFIGRINAGVEARLGPELFGIARQVLAARPQETDLSVLWVNLGELLSLTFSAAQFKFALRSAEGIAGTIRIARATRHLSIERPSDSAA